MIGILGGYGYVGIYSTRFLSKYSCQKLRIGGRNIDAVSSEIRQEFGDAEWCTIETNYRESLEKFAENCCCLLDCAKLTERESALMDQIAETKGIPVLHLGIKGFVRRNANIPVLYGAGCLPGISGLLPQYLAKDFDRVHTLDFYYGGIGAFSYTAAKDYIEGLYDNGNRTMVCWKDGAVVPFSPSGNDVTAVIDAPIAEYKLFPYFDEEASAITRILGLNEGRFQMCLAGKRTLEALNSARHQYRQNPEETVKKLCTASRLDMFGLKENSFYLCIMEGEKSDKSIKRFLKVSGLSPAKMTGYVAGASALCVAQGGASNGCMLLGESGLFERVVNSLIEKEKDFVCNVRNWDDTDIEGEI